MGSDVRSLSEPQVLAHTKRRLFPDDRTEATRSYAVADTQFAQDEWRPGHRIAPAVRERLAPFNHVQVGSGYPDLVGVGCLESELLAVDRLGDEPPLIAVEAKGYASRGVDTHQGIVQAYDRLHEANAAYVAAPADAISATDRTLARELNVGVLGVDADGAVRPIEVPRVVGNRTTGEATAVRFQASAQGVAEQSFGLNHPKNYLGYPLALAADGETERLLSTHDIVGAAEDARRGAAFLGLIETGPTTELTALGREVVRFGMSECGSLEAALGAFESWYRSRTRFIDDAPAWGRLARRILFAYPATELLVGELQTLYDDWVTEPSLVEFVEHLHELHPSVAIELFVRNDEGVRRRVLTADGALQADALEDGGIYHSPTVFQLKTMLYHVGILTDRGTEPHRLEPREDVWALRHPV
ncbi:hypothetical protein D8Y22_07010 [Salinadaptatus halalkaliphilus]|uniref:Uncharacterized protein n=1 Tax=Salinadaptatus halalkaliphilus TaxID=2419781 RepID=A0A4V6RUD9_9EURY|nr:hypothetical protein [Salinadaptatus halalkaliphilus]THE65557.1 hypothetical protein D8Y22_07010 [Salinadaptatus halalkaliphilus]